MSPSPVYNRHSIESCMWHRRLIVPHHVIGSEIIMRGKRNRLAAIECWFAIAAQSLPLVPQGTRADYERANGLRTRFEGLATGLPEPAVFIEGTNDFWYRRFVKGGYEFVAMNADTLAKRAAFDHERLAAAIS